MIICCWTAAFFQFQFRFHVSHTNCICLLTYPNRNAGIVKPKSTTWSKKAISAHGWHLSGRVTQGRKVNFQLDFIGSFDEDSIFFRKREKITSRGRM